jgi:uncharacterized membrane protein YeiH
VTSTEALYLLGTAVFAITGVLAAARQNMDVMSFVIIGVVTAIGGGTIRDVILDSSAFWLQDTSYLYVAAGAAVVAFFFESRLRETYNVLLYLDALATAMFTVLATERTLRLGFSPGVAVLMGVLTGIGGGLIRDLLTGAPTLLMRRELFMTPIILGGFLYVEVRTLLDVPQQLVALVAIVVITAVRFGAIRWGWAFPDWLTYRPAR